jgi:hypothetical protein
MVGRVLIVQVNPLVDSEVEGPEDVVIELTHSSSYTLVAPHAASVIVHDADSPLPMVSIDVLDARAAEPTDAAMVPVAFQLRVSGQTTLLSRPPGPC